MSCYRDICVPYTEAELEEFSNGCKALSSYTAENGGSISVDQIPEMLKLAKLERTPEQLEAYKKYFTDHFNGRLDLGPCVNQLKNVHKNEQLFRAAVEHLDKDGDGFISEGEFDGLLKALAVHDPALQNYKLSYEEFVKEADTNKDGKVNLDECTKWFKNKVNPGF